MDLRRYLDDATMRELSAMASTPKPHRGTSKVGEKPRLDKATSKIERRERRKRERQAQRSAAPTSKSEKQLKPTSKRVDGRTSRPRKSAVLSAEARKLNGLPVSNGGPTRVRVPKRDPLLDVMPSPAPSRAVRRPVPQPTFSLPQLKPFRPKPTDRVRCGAVRSQLKLKEKQVAELCAELSVTVRRSGSGDYIMGFDYDKLRRHVEREGNELSAVEDLSFEEKLRRTRGSSQWQAEGTPLERYERKKSSPTKPTPRRTSDSASFIQVVSGGLPTLGKGRR